MFQMFYFQKNIFSKFKANVKNETFAAKNKIIFFEENIQKSFKSTKNWIGGFFSLTRKKQILRFEKKIQKPLWAE